MSITNLSRLGFYIALVLTTLLAILPQQHSSISLGWDKTNHGVAFFILLLLFDISYPLMKLLLTKCILLLFYGLLIEAIQHFLPDRYASRLDVLADVVGLFAYLIVRAVVIRIVAKVGVTQSKL